MLVVKRTKTQQLQKYSCETLLEFDQEECTHKGKCVNKKLSTFLNKKPKKRYELNSHVSSDGSVDTFLQSSIHLHKGSIIAAFVLGPTSTVEQPMKYQVFVKDEKIFYTMEGDACYFNHSCQPNCQMKTKSIGGIMYIFFVALKRIIPGHKLTFQYRCNILSDMGETVCECGSVGCCFTIASTNHNPKINWNYKCSIIKCQKYALGGKKATCRSHSKK